MSRRLAIALLVTFTLPRLVAAMPPVTPPAPVNKQQNRLAFEKSPYLLQHKDNPVHWYAWGPEAFQKAKKEDKPIFLSIGYSTCYWCHVMEEDSFERNDVAAALNEHFISIKVDREERPDVDQIYMDAVMAMTGHGGWPLSLFLTPDGKPFYGGTFFRREQFLQLLTALSKAWESERAKVLTSSEELTSFVTREAPALESAKVPESILSTAFSSYRENFDQHFGGFGGAPKFPPTDAVAFLLRYYRRSADKSALEMATLTLEKMAQGGIYDQLGGGFARYSTDKKWLVPHFEKMLYDNALLAVNYLEAYQLTKQTHFAAIARETLDYVLREMTAEDGTFYSAQDAGEVGKEGAYYVWEESELRQLLSPDEFSTLKRTYWPEGKANFEEEKIVLHRNSALPWDEFQSEALRAIRSKLLAARAKRSAPHLDDKILTSWNALMIQAFAFAGLVLDEERYASAARRAALSVKKRLYRNNRLLRRYRDGDARYEAYLDDYAFMIQALITLFEMDADRAWIDWALDLQATQDKLFLDTAGKGYYFASATDSSLLTRKKVFYDGAEPSGNSVAALNLLRLYDLTYDDTYRRHFDDIVAASAPGLTRAPQGFGALLRALDYDFDGAKEIVVVGTLDDPKVRELRRFAFGNFLPNKVFIVGPETDINSKSALAAQRGKVKRQKMATFYVCEEGSCKQPTTDVAAAEKLIDDYKPIQ